MYLLLSNCLSKSVLSPFMVVTTMDVSACVYIIYKIFNKAHLLHTYIMMLYACMPLTSFLFSFSQNSSRNFDRRFRQEYFNDYSFIKLIQWQCLSKYSCMWEQEVWIRRSMSTMLIGCTMVWGVYAAHAPMLVFAGLYVKFLPGTTFWAIAPDSLSITDSRVSALYVSFKETSMLQ